MTLDKRPLPNDRVSFPYRRGRAVGTVVAAHAKTATVQVEGGERYRVPWDILTAEAAGAAAVGARRSRRGRRHSWRSIG